MPSYVVSKYILSFFGGVVKEFILTPHPSRKRDTFSRWRRLTKGINFHIYLSIQLHTVVRRQTILDKYISLLQWEKVSPKATDEVFFMPIIEIYTSHCFLSNFYRNLFTNALKYDIIILAKQNLIIKNRRKLAIFRGSCLSYPLRCQ